MNKQEVLDWAKDAKFMMVNGQLSDIIKTKEDKDVLFLASVNSTLAKGVIFNTGDTFTKEGNAVVVNGKVRLQRVGIY